MREGKCEAEKEGNNKEQRKRIMVGEVRRELAMRGRRNLKKIRKENGRK